jgi:uncharacterized protein (DUF1697 family)
MTQYIALLRGINVGKAKRIAMADLRALLQDLGGADVRTLLNSGNAVFRSESSAGDLSAQVESEIVRRFNFSVRVVILSAADLDAIIAADPLLDAAPDPSKHMLAFPAEPAALEKARPLLGTDWTPDRLAVGSQAAYLWCAAGVIESRLLQAFSRATGEGFTARNWATALKLQAMTHEG